MARLPGPPPGRRSEKTAADPLREAQQADDAIVVRIDTWDDVHVHSPDQRPSMSPPEESVC